MITVAITMRITAAQNYYEPRDSISHDWLNFLTHHGLSPLPVPNLGNNTVDYVAAFTPVLLILSGGEDIGAEPLRDETETTLLQFALDTDLPVLGVCRGMQLINTYFGGSTGSVNGHIATTHAIRICPAWQSYYGISTIVNSYHNCAVLADGMAPTLDVTALDDDGRIEAFRHPQKKLAAVMWHPERQNAPTGDIKMITSLIG